MRKTLILMLVVSIISSCKTSKEGCAGSSYQGPKFKASKFDWYKN